MILCSHELLDAAKTGLRALQDDLELTLESSCIPGADGKPRLDTLDDDQRGYVDQLRATIEAVKAAIDGTLPRLDARPEDRKSAARFYDSVRNPMWADEVRKGRADDDPAVQLAARERLNSATRLLAGVSLAECPIGLFWCGDTLCFKTEYGDNNGRIDAYIVESGEFFWGDAPQTVANQRSQKVVPIDSDDAINALRLIGKSGEAVRG